MTLNKKTPFAGTFDIRFLKLSHWKGQMKRDEDTWDIRVTCIDR